MDRYQRIQQKKVDSPPELHQRWLPASSVLTRGFGVQKRSAASGLASKAELWDNYQSTKQLNQRGSKWQPIQAKLTIGQPGDKYEQEADSVAERVMAMSAPAQVQREELPEEEEELQMKPLAETISPLVQREELPEEEEELQMKPEDNAIQREELPEEEEELQMKSVDHSIQREELPEEEEELQMKQSPASNPPVATPSLENQLSSSKGGGSPLSDEVRSFMEPRFGADFSGVRVHTGSDAVQMNRDVSAQAFAHGSDIYFGAGKAPGKDALTAHELTHVVQQSGVVNQKSIQRAATSLVQRDKIKALETQTKALETRTMVLEQKTAAQQLDLKYRAMFGEKVSGYKQVVYRLTGGFQSALNGYQSVQAKQAASDAVKDQLLATVLLVAGAVVLEPFLSGALGSLGKGLDKVDKKIVEIKISKGVEKLENPGNALASGVANTGTTVNAGDRAVNAQASGVPGGGGAGTGGSDPLMLLASNMEALEKHTQHIERAFSNRATEYDTLTPEQWDKWNKDDQEVKYKQILAELDTVALNDIAKVKDPQPLAETLELVLWAGWVRTFFPVFHPLVVKAIQARRLKELGVENKAGVILDTTYIFFDSHKSKDQKKAFETAMYEWGRKVPEPLTK